MKRKIEVFVSDCPICIETVKRIKTEACQNCDIEVLNIKEDKDALTKSREYNVKHVPSVAIDGKLASCCENGGIDIEVLKNLGLGS
ncbi:MAG TPA: thioredoxin family protein [Ignavibacteria bacterium]|nr:thioredoxin family protein [Ignavibacteria bacterium]